MKPASVLATGGMCHAQNFSPVVPTVSAQLEVLFLLVGVSVDFLFLATPRGAQGF